MRKIGILFGTFAILGVFVAAVPTVFAAEVFNFHVPVSGVLTDGCTGNLQNFTGNFHGLLTETESRNGGFHVHLTSNLDDFRLYDTVTGLTCVGVNNTAGAFPEPGFEFNTAPGAATEYTAAAHGAAICPGPNNNGSFQYVVHVTVTPDGDVSTFVDHFMSRCDQ